MTTNETCFFRDPAHYEAIRTVLLPRLKEECRDSRKLRFWSAAASTGQEACSLAMLLLEDGLADWIIQILGTDYSTPLLERARSGKYQQIEVNRGLPAARLVKYFRRSGVEWQLIESVRRLVRFGPIDLRKSMRALGLFELVFSRNVMIYFDNETKAAILKELHGTLFRGGPDAGRRRNDQHCCGQRRRRQVAMRQEDADHGSCLHAPERAIGARWLPAYRRLDGIDNARAS